MLKQSENKSHTADVYAGTFGATVRRRDLEDPQRPGHLREGLLLEPDQWAAAQHFGLRTPGGRSIGFIELSKDPGAVTSADAPAPLLAALAAAEAARENVLARLRAAVDARAEAQDAQRVAAARQDRRGYDQAVVREQEALAVYRDLEAEDAPARKRYSNAQEAVRRWIWDEQVRRSQARS